MGFNSFDDYRNIAETYWQCGFRFGASTQRQPASEWACAEFRRLAPGDRLSCVNIQICEHAAALIDGFSVSARWVYFFRR
jgi:hypothetical protein